MALQLPAVSIDDLHRFHVKHFPNAALPEQYLQGAEEEGEHEYDDYDNDGLGYYSDGVKRTLTDDQIAMFRHTEIQTILRERQRQLEDSESLHALVTPQPAISTREAFQKPERTPSPNPSSEHGTPMSISSNDDKTQTTRPEVPQQWIAVSAKSRARNAKNRNKNRKNYRARKKEQRKNREQEENLKDDEEESDEWDPWHQANGADVQKDSTIDLEY